jgi:hypothetical protein
MTISLELLMQWEDVSVAFSLEASKMSWRWHILWNMTDKWVEGIFKCGMVSGVCAVCL